MKALYTPKVRRGLYAASECGKKWPDSIPWVGKDDRLYGMWILGQDYRNKTPYYGAYPPNYLDRIFSLFPDVQHDEIIHLFSGSLPEGTKGLRVDVNKKLKPDIVWDAHQLSRCPALRKGVNLIIADPPYSIDDAKRYGTAMIKRKNVLEECAKILRPGGWIVWLDQAMPMYSKDRLNIQLAGAIGIIRSTNHRFRVVTFFRKTEPKVVRVRRIAA
jgi:hypothetical protein